MLPGSSDDGLSDSQTGYTVSTASLHQARLPSTSLERLPSTSLERSPSTSSETRSSLHFHFRSRGQPLREQALLGG